MKTGSGTTSNTSTYGGGGGGSTSIIIFVKSVYRSKGRGRGKRIKSVPRYSRS